MISSRRIILHTNNDRKEYFFSLDHCQAIKAPATYPQGGGWVPTTFYLPMNVLSRPSLPSGIVATREDLIAVFYFDGVEIPNPDPRFAI